MSSIRLADGATNIDVGGSISPSRLAGRRGAGARLAGKLWLAKTPSRALEDPQISFPSLAAQTLRDPETSQNEETENKSLFLFP
jgi:hypothetical protein